MPKDDRVLPALKTRMVSAEKLAGRNSVLKAYEQTLPTLNDFLQKILTLKVALIGGGFAIAKGDILPYWWGVATLGILMLGLTSTLYGLIPGKGVYISPNDGDSDKQLKAYDRKLTDRKGIAIKGALFFLIIALLVGIGGLVRKGAPVPPEEPKPVRVIVIPEPTPIP